MRGKQGDEPRKMREGRGRIWRDLTGERGPFYRVMREREGTVAGVELAMAWCGLPVEPFKTLRGITLGRR